MMLTMMSNLANQSFYQLFMATDHVPSFSECLLKAETVSENTHHTWPPVLLIHSTSIENCLPCSSLLACSPNPAKPHFAILFLPLLPLF